ncbi:cell surface protein [Bacteroides reticulotermitis]|uniref:cell surface protein n=1 Tax=Bacteroides reticulotermitis TaxID=1133319 RepID=UPI003A8356EA
MKKYQLFLAAAAIALSSCGNDHDVFPEIPEDPEVPKLEVEVLEYRPAPGQFINENFDVKTMAEANAYAEGRFKSGYFVSLGAFGGYITVKMPEEIKNQKGYDFGIIGNPFTNSSEPGIVWVSEDTNGNGIADDTWYELLGSDEAKRNYSVTYHRPAEVGDIEWEDNQEGSGVIKYLPQFHDQMYYPNWIKEDAYTLTGSMLAPRTIFEDNVWKNQDFEYGYADNLGKDSAFDKDGRYLYNQFDLDNAIDLNGEKITLKSIHFVKVQSAILKNVEAIGEVSTEVCGFVLF